MDAQTHYLEGENNKLKARIKKLEADKKKACEIARWYMELRTYPNYKEDIKSIQYGEELKALEDK